jgi:hypothetical protein
MKEPMAVDPDQLPVILLTETSATVPALIAARGHHPGRRFVEFFTANILLASSGLRF